MFDTEKIKKYQEQIDTIDGHRYAQLELLYNLIRLSKINLEEYKLLDYYMNQEECEGDGCYY